MSKFLKSKIRLNHSKKITIEGTKVYQLDGLTCITIKRKISSNKYFKIRGCFEHSKLSKKLGIKVKLTKKNVKLR